MELLLLDFDGVICDSAGETGSTGWLAAHALWPHDFAPTPSAEYLAAFRRLRPALETGYESILIARLWRDGLPTAELLADFAAQAKACADKYGVGRQELVARFSDVRDRLLRDRFADWLALHRFYPGVVEALDAARARGAVVAIITTKQHRFARALLDGAGSALPDDLLFGLESGPKPQVIRDLLARFPQASAVWFVEDRLKTLDKVAAEPDLRCLRLALADWGYCLPEAVGRARAAGHAVLDLPAFTRLLRGE